MNLWKVFKNGLIDENPTFRLVLGMCPTLAVSNSAINGLGMGLAATFVLVFSGLAISLLRKAVPEKIRIPSYIVIIAGLVSVVEIVIKAYFNSLYNALGIFIPLIVVNCIIFARAESFAGKNSPIPAAIDGLGMGLGYTGALTLLSILREILGRGTIFGFAVLGSQYQPMLLAVLAPGGFIMLGLLLGAYNRISEKIAAKASLEAANGR